MKPPIPPFECKLCKSHLLREQVVAREMCKGTRDEFTYALCGNCGTLQLTNYPSDYAYYYEGYYSLAHDELRLNFIKKLIWNILLLRFQKLGDFVLKHFKKHVLEVRAFRGLPRKADWKILDVGSGAGSLINFLATVGFRHCLGCDPFIEADIEYGSGARVLKKGIDQIEGAFDLVMLHHALEHVPDPANVIRHIARLMQPAGYCILRFPNINSIEYRRYKGNWWGIHAPYHTFLYSREAMELLAGENGLVITNAYCDSRYDHYAYSQEYSLDIDDKSPLSRRNGGGVLSPAEEKLLVEKALDYDRKGIGDWIVYILRHKSAA